MLRYLVVVTLALTFLPSAGFAQSRSGTSAEHRACRSDVVRFCRTSLDAGELAIANCLSAHRDRLHNACRAVLSTHGL
jgi:hypothetical protein